LFPCPTLFRSQSAPSSGCAVTLAATPSWSPVIQRGTRSVAGSTQVWAPGQLASTASRRSAGSACQSTRPSSCAASAATSSRPLPASRRLMASRRITAASSKGSQPRPHTASVGQAMTPPRRRAATAASSPGWGAMAGSERCVGVVDRAGGGPRSSLFHRRLPGDGRRGSGYRLLRGLLRRLLRRLLGRLAGGLPGHLAGRLLRRRLLRGNLLRRGLLAEAPAHRLAGFLQQLDDFLERQRRRFAILR